MHRPSTRPVAVCWACTCNGPARLPSNMANQNKAGQSVATLPSAGPKTDEFAASAGLHPESVRRAIRQGRIPAIKFGRTWRIPPAAAERILREGLPS